MERNGIPFGAEAIGKIVITIQIWFGRTRFRKDSSVRTDASIKMTAFAVSNPAINVFFSRWHIYYDITLFGRLFAVIFDIK